MKYNRSEIFSHAWRIYRKAGVRFGEALHRAWQAVKAAPINAARIAAAAAEAGVSEAVNTWARWREQGFEVIHGSKRLFQAVLIYATRGDGQTYLASFFGASQVQPAEN